MQITFLGTGAATAVPLPFCNCKTCKCARVLKGKDVRKRASILINDDLLIDLGPDVISACMQYNKDLTQVKYILQTHAHSDHFDAGHLITRHRDYAGENINPLKIVASYGTLEAMNKALKGEEDTIDLFNGVSQSALSLTVDSITHQEEKWIGEYKVTGLESLHDTNQESLIYLIETKGKSVLYGTDLLEISEKVYALLKGKKIDVIILDQTYGEGYNAGGHLDAGQIKAIILKMNKLGIMDEYTYIYATHISHEGNGVHSEMVRLAHQSWYEKGYWRDKYFPYTLFEGNKAVANVSASMIHTLVEGKPKLYIQIGTVMTDPEYRKCGLSRRLLQTLLEEWKDKCDGIYLYANETVLDFYPKFGFEPAMEYRYSKTLTAKSADFIKLDMDQEEDVELFECYYNKSNPFSERPMLYNFGLIMFYCGTFMKDCVYYSKELECVVIASYEGNVMTCYDVYCDAGKEREAILQGVAQQGIAIVQFGFMPKETENCKVELIQGEDQLFVYRSKENMFRNQPMMLPLLSHA